ncbi:MAG: PIN domain-containing protein [Syntrophobacteraceae bacterium]
MSANLKSLEDAGALYRDAPPVALLWTQSLVWGLLCIDTLSLLGIPFELLDASDVCEGRLERFQTLIVPGGWAAHKAHALGEKGRSQLAAFLDEGGSYLGFCGGAGLALSSPPALYLVPVRRMPLSERLPSASGQVYVSGMRSHPAWKDIPDQIPVSVWWPSQFLVPSDCEVSRLASYTNTPGEDFQVADLRVCDMEGTVDWGELESAYGINLDPARIEGHPAILEVFRGKGRLVLSYAHLETPGDICANQLFSNLLHYLGVSCCGRSGGKRGQGGRLLTESVLRKESNPGAAPSGILRARKAASDLIAFGEANLLWNWRKPWLLYWRRGIRGLEYGSLFVCLCCLAELEQSSRGRLRAPEHNHRVLDEFLGPFEICPFDSAAAAHYGEIRSHLRRNGALIGNMDLLIAAHARRLSVTLVTNNMKEFERVPDLKLENWLS